MRWDLIFHLYVGSRYQNQTIRLSEQAPYSLRHLRGPLMLSDRALSPCTSKGYICPCILLIWKLCVLIARVRRAAHSIAPVCRSSLAREVNEENHVKVSSETMAKGWRKKNNQGESKL